jgi:hypothetical protein
MSLKAVFKRHIVREQDLNPLFTAQRIFNPTFLHCRIIFLNLRECVSVEIIDWSLRKVIIVRNLSGRLTVDGLRIDLVTVLISKVLLRKQRLKVILF